MTAAAQAAAASCIEINRIIETVEHYRRSPAFRKLAGIRRKYRHGLKNANYMNYTNYNANNQRNKYNYFNNKKLHKTTFYSLSNSKNYNHYEKLLL